MPSCSCHSFVYCTISHHLTLQFSSLVKPSSKSNVWDSNFTCYILPFVSSEIENRMNNHCINQQRREEGYTSCMFSFSFIIYMQMEHYRGEPEKNILIYPNLAQINSLCINLHTQKGKKKFKTILKPSKPDSRFWLYHKLSCGHIVISPKFPPHPAKTTVPWLHETLTKFHTFRLRQKFHSCCA